MWLALLGACDPSPPRGHPGDRPDPSLLPEVPDGVPAVSPGTVTAPEPSPGCADGTLVVTAFTGPLDSGVLIVDRLGRVVWAWLVPDRERRVLRARPAADGDGVLALVGDREVDNGDGGAIVRLGLYGDLLTETPVRDPHHDFLELGDGRLAYLSYEFSQPNDGATLQYFTTDRIRAIPEGGGTDEVVFSTLSDFTHLNDADLPPEGVDGRTLPGFDVWGQGASLGRAADGTLFLMWRWQDTLLGIEPDGEVRWAIGGPWPGLHGPDTFEHAHFSEVSEGDVLVFDNRRPDGPSRLLELAYDDTSYREVWSLEEDEWEPGIGDVKRVPGCDTVLSTWPTTGRLREQTRDGREVWSVTVDASVERGEIVSSLPFLEL